ncbi:hypothetical protein BDV06DRAFT_96547 [Aspergillus oleicola]
MASHHHRQQSPVLGIPIALRILWCMRCFREAVTAFNPNFQKPLVINCCMDATGANRCRDCFRAGAHCHQAATGMLGDAEDLMKTIDQVKMMIEHPSIDKSGWKIQVRTACWRALQHLSSAFSSAELAHRQFHGLDLPKKDHEKPYSTYLFERRQFLGALPILPPNATRADRFENAAARLLRLLPGDEGYLILATAKMRFIGSLKNAIRDQHEVAEQGSIKDDEAAARLIDALDVDFSWLYCIL